MLRSRKKDLVIALTCLSLIAVLSNSIRNPVKGSDNSPGIPEFSLKWSLLGGCFGMEDFYFQLESDSYGSSWMAVHCAFDSFPRPRSRRQVKMEPVKGNYLAQGRLNPDQTLKLMAQLKELGALEIKTKQFHTGPSYTLSLKLGGQRHTVNEFQAQTEGVDTANKRFETFTYSGFLWDIQRGLRDRHQAGEAPDFPYEHLEKDWLTNEKNSLFNRYRDTLTNTLMRPAGRLKSGTETLVERRSRDRDFRDEG